MRHSVRSLLLGVVCARRGDPLIQVSLMHPLYPPLQLFLRKPLLGRRWLPQQQTGPGAVCACIVGTCSN